MAERDANETRIPRTLVAWKDLPAGAKFSRVYLNRLIDEGRFPAPVQLSRQRIAWYLDEVLEWIETRPRVERKGRKHTLKAMEKMRAAWASRRAAAAKRRDQSDAAHQASRADQDTHVAAPDPDRGQAQQIEPRSVVGER
jgi:predicted DNA-binding transcriptional regulator AlpA